jgi:hypothetical protein
MKSEAPIQKPRTLLRRSKNEATTAITDRIQAGEELLKKCPSSRLENISNEYRQWYEYTTQFLLNLFTTDVESEKFKGATGVTALNSAYMRRYYGYTTQNHEFKELENIKNDIKGGVNMLLSLTKRIELFEQEMSISSLPTAIETISPSDSPRPAWHQHPVAIAVTLSLGAVVGAVATRYAPDPTAIVERCNIQ